MAYRRQLLVVIMAFLFGACAGHGDGAVLPMSPESPNLPNGYTWLAYLDCGPERARVEINGLVIEQTRGGQRLTPSVSGPETDVACDAAQVEFTVSGLEATAEYILGFTWYDADSQGRSQAVKFGVGEPVAWKTVLPATKPMAFHADQPVPAHVLLPIPSEYYAAGAFQFAITNDAGPDAVVSEVWVLKKSDITPRKRVLIVTGDDYPGHRWQETGPELAAILREDPRLEVSIIECPAIFASPLIDHYDAAFVHFKNYSARLPLGEVVWNGVKQYADSGHGLVFVHFACGAFEDWKGYVQIAGRVWDPRKRGHDPYGPFNVRIADSQHTVTNGMQAFDTTDELYTCLAGDTTIHTLCEATSKVDQLVYPMAFTVPELKGHVLHCIFGHDKNALGSAGTRDLYRRAAAWAAGLDKGGSAVSARTK